jgi:hypothetical protein
VTTGSQQVKSRLRVILTASVVAGVVPATTGGADRGAKANGLQHVTLMGDSVATALPLDDVAVQTLRSGVDLDLPDMLELVHFARGLGVERRPDEYEVGDDGVDVGAIR